MRQRQQDRRGQHHAHPGDEGRRHAAVDRDLDEEVRDAPQQRQRGEAGPGACAHRGEDARGARRAPARAGRATRARRSVTRLETATSPAATAVSPNSRSKSPAAMPRRMPVNTPGHAEDLLDQHEVRDHDRHRHAGEAEHRRDRRGHGVAAHDGARAHALRHRGAQVVLVHHLVSSRRASSAGRRRRAAGRARARAPAASPPSAAGCRRTTCSSWGWRCRCSPPSRAPPRRAAATSGRRRRPART